MAVTQSQVHAVWEMDQCLPGHGMQDIVHILDHMRISIATCNTLHEHVRILPCNAGKVSEESIDILFQWVLHLEYQY
jgi:hypothetical protein